MRLHSDCSGDVLVLGQTSVFCRATPEETNVEVRGGAISTTAESLGAAILAALAMASWW